MLTSLVGSIATGAGPGAGAKNVGGAPPTPTASVEATGTLAVSPDQDGIVTGGYTLILTTTNCTWVPTIAADNSFTTGLLAGITSAQVEAAGYDAVKGTYLTFSNVVRTSDNIVTITLPAFTAYAVTASETLTIVVPADNVEYSTGALTAALNPVIANVAESCAVTGTITTAAYEDEIQVGGDTLVLTLTGDQWVATVGADNAITTALIVGLDSGQAEGTGWDAVVRVDGGTGLTHANVARTSDTVVTITLPAFATYDITANETITCTVPATALLASSGTIVASPTIDIAEAAVVLTGTAVSSMSEAEGVTGGETVIFTVTGDTWAATLGADNAITTAFLVGVDSGQAEAAGWDAEIRDNLAFGSLTRDSATQCTLVLPASASYATTATETITATIPATALVGSPSALVATPTFTVITTSDANLVIDYNFEDWTGDAYTTPGWIFRLSYKPYFDDRTLTAIKPITACSGRTPYSGTYFLRRRMDENADTCLGTTPGSENAYVRFGNGDALYPGDGTEGGRTGDLTDLRTAITGEVMTVRFRFRLTGNWPPAGVASTFGKFIRPLFGDADYESDDRCGHLQFLSTAAQFAMYDAGNVHTSYYSVDPNGDPFDLDDGAWHAMSLVCTRLNETTTDPNYNMEFWIDDWAMAGTSWGAKDLYVTSPGTAPFRAVALWVNYGGAPKPTEEHAIEYDDFEVWDGLPS